MAHKKGGGSTKNGRDSNAQRRGMKLFGGQLAKPGSIIARQCGTKWRAGKNVRYGKDWTIFSTIHGLVTFEKKGRQISVYPVVEAVKEPVAEGK